jgi:hypothetical protein
MGIAHYMFNLTSHVCRHFYRDNIVQHRRQICKFRRSCWSEQDSGVYLAERALDEIDSRSKGYAVEGEAT